MSRMQPPPQAVVMARTRVPKRSIFLLMPTSAPEMAKAMVPMRSKSMTNASVMKEFRPFIKNTWAIIHISQGLGKRKSSISVEFDKFTKVYYNNFGLKIMNYPGGFLPYRRRGNPERKECF